MELAGVLQDVGDALNLAGALLHGTFASLHNSVNLVRALVHGVVNLKVVAVKEWPDDLPVN